MDCSIIIVSYNTKKLLSDCITSINETLEGVSFSYEIIVVDNASTDGSREFLKKQKAPVSVFLNKENEGFGKGNNQGIIKAKGEYVLLLNSDTKVEKQAIETLLLFSKTHPNTFVGPKLFNADGTPQTSCGPFFTLPVVFAALFLKGDINGLTRWSPNVLKQVDWLSGAAIMGKKALFEDGLLFDEGIFMYMEEVDLLYRAKRKGIKTYFLPESHIIHLGCGGSTERRKHAILNIYRGFLYLYQKHYGETSYSILKMMLKFKAFLGIIVGSMTGNEDLKETYEKAYRLV